jgi:hypothetical protein
MRGRRRPKAISADVVGRSVRRSAGTPFTPCERASVAPSARPAQPRAFDAGPMLDRSSLLRDRSPRRYAARVARGCSQALAPTRVPHHDFRPLAPRRARAGTRTLTRVLP